jgi:hypothetical protein
VDDVVDHRESIFSDVFPCQNCSKIFEKCNKDEEQISFIMNLAHQHHACAIATVAAQIAVPPEFVSFNDTQLLITASPNPNGIPVIGFVAEFEVNNFNVRDIPVDGPTPPRYHPLQTLNICFGHGLMNTALPNRPIALSYRIIPDTSRMFVHVWLPSSPPFNVDVTVRNFSQRMSNIFLLDRHGVWCNLDRRFLRLLSQTYGAMDEDERNAMTDGLPTIPLIFTSRPEPPLLPSLPSMPSMPSMRG